LFSGAISSGIDGSNDETICNGGDGGEGVISNITGTLEGYGGGGGGGGSWNTSISTSLGSSSCVHGLGVNGGGNGGRGYMSAPGKDGTGGGGGNTVNRYNQTTRVYIRGGRGDKGGNGVVIIRYS
jgi:hypothetical protein